MANAVLKDFPKKVVPCLGWPHIYIYIYSDPLVLVFYHIFCPRRRWTTSMKNWPNLLRRREMALGEKILPVVVGDVRKRMKKEIYRVLKDARCPHKKKQDLDLKF